MMAQKAMLSDAVTDIPSDFFRIFLSSGLTAEEFISKPRGLRDSVITRSRYDIFRSTVAHRLGVDPDDVDVFAVSGHGTLARTIDIWYSVSAGDVYFRPARLDGLVLTHRDEVSV